MPYLGSTIFIGSMIAALLVATNAWWLLWRSLAPSFVRRAEERITRRPILTTLLGGVVGGFFTIVAIAIGSIAHPVAKLASVALIAILAAIALAGTAGLASRIGRGLTREGEPEWRAQLRGGLVLELVFLLPLVGTFVVLPIAIYGGLGAALAAWASALVSRKSEPMAHVQPA